MPKYVLDTNCFIEAHRAHYPFDVFPGFWQKLEDLQLGNVICSFDKVKDELLHVQSPGEPEDLLSQWSRSNPGINLFEDCSVCVNEYASIVRWAQQMSHHYQQTAIDTFMDTRKADAWLIAYSLHNSYPLVTYEKSNPNRKNNIKIPEPCDAFGVRYLSPIEMFRELGISF